MSNYLFDYMIDQFNKNYIVEFSPLMFLLDLYGIDRMRVKWDHYKFDNIGVPRVTNILDDINSKDLSAYIANLGKQYFSERRRILDTGSLTHAMIEDYLMYGGKASFYDQYNNADKKLADNAFNNFKNWYSDAQIKGYTIEPLFTERQIVTPFYGGTCDLCTNITYRGKTRTYIIDFKTSKRIQYEYFIQIMYYILGMKFNNETNHEQFPHIDGLGIIRVNKVGSGYQYIFADFENDPEFMQALIESVYTSLQWYYQKISIMIQSYDYEKSFNW